MVKGSVGRCRSRWFWADVDLSVVGHDGNGVYGSVTEGITGASTDGNGDLARYTEGATGAS